MTYAQQLRPLVDRHGTIEAARICGVSPRSLQLWMRGAEPCAAMQAGTLLLLSDQPASVAPKAPQKKRKSTA